MTVQPNIIFILTDDQDMLSLNVMTKLKARTDLINFPNAFVETALCCPSRCSTLTGKYDTHTGVFTNHDGANFNEALTIATVLQDSGYYTGFYGKYTNNYPFNRGNYTPDGWSDWHAFEKLPHYFNYKMVENGVLVSYPGTSNSNPENYSTDVIFNKAVAKINSLGSTGQPFFLWVAPFAPHAPQTPAPRHVGTIKPSAAIHEADFNVVGTDAPVWQQNLTALDPHKMDVEQTHLWETMLAVDDGIANIFAALSAKGILDNTIVIFMTDNGINLGAHRWEEKRTEDEESGKSPFFARMPGGLSFTCNNMISNIDIAPTLADAAGIIGWLGTVDGISILPWLEGSTAIDPRPAILQHWHGGNASGGSTGLVVPGYWGVRILNWKYVELDTGEKELYNLSSDPKEMINLANNFTSTSQVTYMASVLAELKSNALS